MPADMPEDADTACDILSFHILIYSLGDRMFIHGLKALSKENVEKELAKRLDARTFPHAIYEIYSSTPASDRAPRDLVVRITMDNLISLRAGAKKMDSTEVGTGEESGPAAFPDSLYLADLRIARQMKPMRPGLLTPSTLTRRDINQSPRPTIAESSPQKAPDFPYKRVLIVANMKTNYAV
ncbi:hypothetical protein N7536_004340 [Penicillium majusculum]|nr:hypothetical protein N7536_004340 [Penicillium majusculum]